MRKACMALIATIFVSLLLGVPISRGQDADLKRASQLNQQVIRLHRQGKYAEAIPVAKEVLAIDEKALGPDHPSVATSANNLAMLYLSLGDYAKAEPLHKRSLAIYEKALGPDHPDVANSLNNLALLYHSLGDYAKAEPLHKRSLAILEKALGPDHPDVASGLNNLAGIYDSLGDYAKTEPLYKRSLAILEKALGPDHPDVASSLNNLAELYRSLGDYAKAEPMDKRALAIREKALGPDHPAVANSLNSLALHYRSLGDYATAESLYKRSLAIREKAFGPDHPRVAGSLNHLAELYRALGDHAKAEPLYKRSLASVEKALGPDHPDVATCLNNLAAHYYSLGDYAKTEPLFKRSLAIYEKALGPDHPYVAGSLNNLAGLYYFLGDYAKAEPLHKRGLAICEKALGPDHPHVAASLNNLALVYNSLGDYAKAEPLYKRSLAILEKTLGPDHPDVAQSLDNLAGLYAAKGDFSKAHSLSIRIQGIDEKLIDQVLGFASEDRQSLFLNARQGKLEAALSLAATHLREDPSVRKDAMDMWLRRKGVVLEAQRRFQEALVYSDDPKAMATFQELAQVRFQLSQLTFGGPGKEGPEVYQRKVAQLQTKKRDLEARLSSLSQAYALKKKVERADSTKVAQALPAKTALLELVRINTFDFKAKGREKKWLPARYLSFVLHAGKGDRVEMVDLGDAEEIDKMIALFKKELGDTKSKEALQEISRKIHAFVFEPLKKALGEVKEVFISPDGNLNLIPFEVLQGPDGRFLIEDYTFNYLAAGRDILGFGEIKEKGGKALLMGDPDFDLGTEEKDSLLRKLALAEQMAQESTKRSLEMRGFSFRRLPGTREEVEAIKGMLGEGGADRYMGKEALEEVLRQKGTPRILHLATHGFFLSNMDISALREEGMGRGIQQMGTPGLMGKGVKVENPLLRSGIALAGANLALRSGEVDRSDGIVTAEKILGLRLRGTEMVVLSACETGLGEVKTGEGVYGLRRAFIQAGTKGLVMSMWSVPDKETKELMVEFYRNMLSGKISRCESLRQAALRQMKVVKQRYGNMNPLYWGGFVFLGEP